MNFIINENFTTSRYFNSKIQGSGFSFKFLNSKFQGSGFSFEFLKYYCNLTIFLSDFEFCSRMLYFRDNVSLLCSLLKLSENDHIFRGNDPESPKVNFES